MNAMRHAATTRATRRPLPLAILLALAACASAPVGAQDAADAAAEPAAQDAADAAADPVAQDAADARLDTIMVTANKREEDVRRVAAPITVIGQEQLESLAATRLTDYADYVPGLQVTSSGSPGLTTVTMRGIAPLSSNSTVATYVDEVPLGSSGIFQAARLLALDLLPYDIERVEVLRGPQGTLYGAGAMGGLLKYVTREPDLESTEVRLGAGIFDVTDGSPLGKVARFGASMPLSENGVGVRVSYARNATPGYIDNEFDGEDNINEVDQAGGRAELMWQGESVNFKLSGMRQTIDSDNNAFVALDPETQDPLYGDLTNRVVVDEPFSRDVDLFAATLEWDLGWGTFTSATGYSEQDVEINQDASTQYGEFANLVLGLPEPGSATFINRLGLEKFSQEFRLASAGDGPFEWLVGGFYTDEDGDNRQTIYLNQLDGSPLPGPAATFGTLADLELPSTFEEYALFANAGYRFNDWFKLSGGLRYSENEQEFVQDVFAGVILPIEQTPGSSDEDVVTWSVTPEFQVSEDALVYARAATGYQPGGPNVALPGLPQQVDSSELISYELGLKSEFLDNRLILDVAAFRIDWEDIQVITVAGGANGLINGGEATSQGVELATAFRATDNLTLSLNATYTDATLDQDFPTVVIPPPPALVEINLGLEGDTLPYVPELAWSAMIDYGFSVGANWNGHLGAGVRWVDDRVSGTSERQVVTLPTDPPTVVANDVTSPTELDSYYALDLFADIGNGHWTVRAYARNVTDERGYQTVTTVSSALTGVDDRLSAAPITPRTIGLEFDYRF